MALAEDGAFPGSRVFQALGESDVAGSLACLRALNSMATLMRTEPADLTPFYCQDICIDVTQGDHKKIQELNLPTLRLESRRGSQEESEMPGKGMKSGD